MGSMGVDSSFTLEALINEHPDVSSARVLKLNSAASSITAVLILSLTDKASSRSTTTATIQKLHTDFTISVARQTEEEVLEVPRAWILFEPVAGDKISSMDAGTVDSILSMSHSENNIEEQVWAVVAGVLQLSPKKVRQATSFTSIGGTARSAIEVQTRCMKKGIILSITNILSGKDLHHVAERACLLLKYGAHPTKDHATEPDLVDAPLPSWGISEKQYKETVSGYFSLDLSGRLAAVGTEPFPLRKSLALLLHATLAPFRELRPNRDSIAVVVKNCYTGNHKILRVDLLRLGNSYASLRYLETLLADAELRPGVWFSGTAEVVLQYEEGNLCDRQKEPREPEDATAYFPSLFAINVHKENARLCLQLQSPRCLDTEGFSAEWLRSCEASLEAFAAEPDNLIASKFWEGKLSHLAPATFPSRSASHQKAATLATIVPVPKQAGDTDSVCSIVQAAWAIVLGRYNDNIDVCYDTSVSPINSIFGPDEAVSYMLPMRVALEGKTPVSELLQTVSHISRDIAVIINQAEDLQEATRSAVNASTYPLELHVQIKESSIEIKFIYDTDAIAEIQCTALANQLQHVISQLSTLDSEPLQSVAIAGPWDLKQALEWNGPPMPVYHQCIHHLIADRAMRDPEREAIYTAETSMTYAALEEEAGLLAAHIVSLGIAPQTVIPICFASSKWAIVAMVGVMKAGCIFMPLDPSHPESRRQGLIAQVGADTVIASSRTAAICQRMCPNVVVLDDLFIAEKLLQLQNKDIPMRACSPNDAAYILFTSGSTGVPKGVQVEHSAASSSIMNFGRKHEATNEMRMLSFASYAFDACIYEIFVPLVLGGAVCIPPEERRLENISPFLAEARVTAALLTPSYVKTLDPDQLPTIDTLIIAGEAATLDVLHTWQNRVRLINCYGPTETCVSVMTYTYDPDFKYTASTRIGTNVHGNCWIVEPDNHNRLTPIGCTGELIVQSHAMAREYYKAPEKTAASFISHVEIFPASTPMRTARCYKTGDLVKYNADGTLEYQGRKDNQIKLRGQRLEPSEIEHVMNLADDRIQSTAVHLTKRKAGNSLVAFIDFKEPLDRTKTVGLAKNDLIPVYPAMEELLADLRTYVATRLPKFMVPSFFVPLNEMPFVTSMKIDRKGLQGLADSLSIEELSKYSAATSGSDTVAPVTPEEFAMRDLWATILNVNPATISRDNSFLHIGGDSISAIHLSSLARKNGLELSTAAIFRDSRLSVMAEVAKPFEIKSKETDDGIEPFSILQTEDLTNTLYELRSICRLRDGEVIDDAYPCTALQEGLLALGVKHPGSYIAKFVYRLDDNIDIVRFKAAWEYLCDTCENMRVRIVKLGTDSIQTLVRGDFAWEPTKNVSLNKFLEVAQNMNMSYGSKLSRSALIKESSGKKYFVWVTHHAVFDGWTVMLVLNALKELYQGNNKPAFTPYSGFVKYASGMDMDSACNYWKRQLRGAQPPAFPSGQVTAAPANSSGKVTRLMKHDIPFPASTKTDITKGTILRAAWALALARYGNTDDVCFGATASGRNANVEGISNMTGTVIGTVPVRVKIDPTKSIRDFLADVQSQALEMVPYEQYGFQNIAKISPEVKAASDVTSLLIVQPQQQVEVMESGTSAFMRTASHDEYSVLDTMEGYFTFPIVIQCPVYSDHVTIDFTYDSSVVSEQQMQSLCYHLESIVGQLLAQDDSKLGDVAVAGAWDMEKAIAFNSHIQEVVSDTCLHDLIAKHATESPDNEAIYSTEMSMTYAELERASSLLAWHLMNLGVTQETVVPICFEKSIWTIIAMLGIMKAGGVFMPMDPTHPYDRRAALIKQVDAQYILTSVDSASSCDKIAEHIIILSSSLLAEVASSRSVENVAFNSDPSSAAYILFTSGSTGQPKGIVVEHTAICSSMISHGKEFGLSKSSRVLQFASYVFDVSVSEILTTLVYGGTVCVPSGTERMQDIASFINKAQTDVAMLTPSFVTTFGPKDVPNLKVLILGGEAPTKTTLSTWQPHVRLLNGYAPAECCIYALTHTYQSVDELPTILGKGIHTNCWIVEPDNHDRLAPIGCVGELVIQGNTIGRGYVNDPEKTSKAFLDNLSWLPKQLAKSNHRYYKSGDLVRYDENGDIEYLGRKDTQVKLRGQRIELGEIEYNIQQSLEGVKYATVEVVRRGQREALVAFISFEDTDNDTANDAFQNDGNLIRTVTPELKTRFQGLLTDLQAKLPPFMVPGLFMALHRTPFLSSMKVNRKTLRNLIDKMSANEYSQLSLSKNEDKSAPMSDMEAKFRDLWAETLGISPEVIGRNDSFFQLGGDSISALNLSSLAQKEGIFVSMSKMLVDPALAAMADAAAQDDTLFIPALPFELLDKSAASSIIHEAYRKCNLRTEREIEDIFPCTAFQEGLIALSVRQPGAYESMAVYRLSAGISVSKFKAAWESTVERCSNLRTRMIVPTNSADGKAVQVITTFKPSWEDTVGHDLASFVTAAKKKHMGYGSALCRYALVEGELPHFVLTIHHATYDLWSMHLILSALREAYDGTEELKLLPYSNFVKHIQQSDLGITQQYWREQLEGAKPATFPRLPANQRKAKAVMKERTAKIAIPGSKRTDITRATLLQAAWSIVLARHSESDDICYGATVTGRLASLSGITNLIGPTITTVPMRCKIDANVSASEFLNQIQARNAGMIPHEQYGHLNIAKLSADARAACDFSTLLIIQPIDQVAAIGGKKPLLEEDTTVATTKLLEGDLQDYFDNSLIINCLLSEDSVELIIYYDSNIVSDDSLAALEHHFGRVTEQLARQDETPIGSLSLVDRWDLDLAMKSQKIPQANESCTHWLVEEQMDLHASRTAVNAWDGDLSYRQLGMAAAELASRLRGHGIAVGDLVLTCLQKSKWSVVAMLAVQLAGGAIIPVEPATFGQSKQAILETTKPKLVLTESSLTKLFVGSECKILLADAAQEAPVKSLHAVLPSHPTPETLSLVLLTDDESNVNGVKLTHSAVSTSIAAYANALGIDESTRMLQQASSDSFLRVVEVLSTLTTGGCVCIPQEDAHQSGLGKAIAEFKANATLTTSDLLEHLQPNQVPTLKTLGLGGEDASKKLLDTWSGIVNTHTFYGTKEALVCAWGKVNTFDTVKRIGEPLSAAFWVVEDSDATQLTPVGCIGELVIESPSIASGYLNETTSTAENFIDDLDCLPGDTTRRVLRTGDLVRRNFDGSFEYIGRKEASQRSNGSRMGLLQAEEHLRNGLPDSMNGTVAKLSGTGDEELVGLLWCTGQLSIGSKISVVTGQGQYELEKMLPELHSYLIDKLPKYLVPASFLLFDGPPSRLSSGRFNRREMLSLASQVPADKRIRITPSMMLKDQPETPTEHKLRDLWAKLLGIPAPEIGRNDSFLGIGGDSISAIQLVTMARNRGLGLSIASIFRDPRLSEVAASAVVNDAEDSEDLEPFALLPNIPSDYTIHEAKQQCGVGQSVLIEDMYPCTKLQEGLMALATSNAGSYVAHHAFRLADDIDVEAFKLAWEHTVEITSTLRTRIVPIHGTFVQVVLEEHAAWEDPSGLNVQQYIARDTKVAMGYGTRLSRYSIVSSKYFVWTVHHAVADGWSINLVLDRVKKIYRRIEVPAIKPFASFIKYIMGADHRASQQFWSDQLQGATRTPFPPDSVEKFKANARYLRVIPHATPADSSITMATVLRSAWSILLGGYCDTDDICFGTTVSGRSAPVDGIEFLAGPTIASVPVRVVIPTQKRIGDFLRDVQNQNLDMIPHEQFGLQRIAKISSDARDACEFSSLMVIQPQRFGGNAETTDVIADRLEDDSDGAADDYYTYPLIVQFNLMDSEFEMNILYAPSQLPESRIIALTHHIEHIVAQLLGNPAKLVEDVSTSGPWDLQKAMDWNQEDQTTVDKCVHDLFEEHVAQDSTRDAVFTTTRTLSYGELDTMSTQLAAYLKSIGVGPQTIVPICMEKSIWPTVSAVAIMKAGGAFMPMDPTHPYNYRQTLVKEANVRVMLTSQSSFADCAGLCEHVVNVSDSLHCFQLNKQAAETALQYNRATPENPVYVIFSSGSTGVPKGIVVEHRSYVSSLTGHGARLGFSRESRTFQFANHVWDVVAFDILTTLAFGGTVCVPSEYERLHSTIPFMNEARCNTALLTPSFIRTIDPDLVPTLKTLASGGEAMDKSILRNWVDKANLFDAYGPAEASCIASIHHYTSRTESGGTIGRPSHNATWVVDPKHPDRLSPIGCEGELVIQGPAVARGYLNNSSLTGKHFSSTVQFLPEELISKSARFYWTGDLVKYNDKGEMLYMGRRDAQIKLRGQRIELGHIEHKIEAAAPQLEAAVVEVIHKGTPAASLVCLMKLASNDCNSGAEEQLLLPNTEALASYVRSVRDKLIGVLPNYMIPAYFIPVSEVPKSRAAKTDRKLIRESVESLSSENLKTYLATAGAEFCDAANETERTIRDAWAAVLRLETEDISTNDNFYEIGGDSISIITLLKRIQNEFGVHLGLSMMNSKSTTISQMAKFVDADTSSEPSVDVQREVAAALSASWVKSIKTAGFVSRPALPAQASVFLTGATGFLGTQLLRSLLVKDSVRRVVALVRAKSAEHGLERLKETARIAGWWDDVYEERVEVWTGDLEDAKLGLKEEQWMQLAGTSPSGQIDAVVHNGAIVNWNADYEKLKNANVRSVLDLLQAVVESPHAPRFVFVSGGVSVDIDADPAAVADEMNTSIGYCQTKYVAEKVVHHLATALPSSQNRFSVLKPGMIIGTAAEGVANLDDFLWRFVATAAKIQLYPLDAEPGFVPVSDGGLVAARTLGQITENNIDAFVNLSTELGLATPDFWAHVNAELGKVCTPIDWATWLERALQDMNETGESHPLWPVQHFAAGGGISGTATLSAPDEAELGRAVRSNVRYLKQVGFISGADEQVQVQGVLRRGVRRS
ncbi:hypothetical protein LMH87_005185 [Akanthomyces muscarius]|uniref:Carrier domain-containing protein n=5 Tax=Akanthomyces muscarius TaxID=2231603 RepID=A0A9W8QMS0_AKAMU|nr:hypothetical protein LMH87_005185 [Akanthomyces muscarius]KAJ4163461.1 hypothetical protein LMH87_005185 [Akanthomyces muscarius]